MDWIRDPRFDVRAIGIGTVVSGALTVAMAVLFAWVTRSSQSHDIGPTAATLADAFAVLSGAALGLLVGSFLTACIARRGSRVATALIAAALGYGLVAVPVSVATASSDVSIGDSITGALLFGVPLGAAALVGAIIGAAVSVGISRSRRRIRSG